MALASLGFRNSSKDDLDVVTAAAPGSLAALSTCCFTAHSFLPSPFLFMNYGQISISRSNDPALEHHLVLSQRGCRSLTRLAFYRYDKLRVSTFDKLLMNIS